MIDCPMIVDLPFGILMQPCTKMELAGQRAGKQPVGLRMSSALGL